MVNKFYRRKAKENKNLPECSINANFGQVASFPGLETGSSSIRRISSRSSSELAIKLVYKQPTITEI
jgi:hypothetical protein